MYIYVYICICMHTHVNMLQDKWECNHNRNICNTTSVSAPSCRYHGAHYMYVVVAVVLEAETVLSFIVCRFHFWGWPTCTRARACSLAHTFACMQLPVRDTPSHTYKCWKDTCVFYRVAYMHRMPQVAGLFPQKSHYLQGSFAENELQR